MGRKRNVLTIAAILLGVFLAGSASAQVWGDGWWNPSESGWGINIVHQADILFLFLYVYDSGGVARWYSASLGEGSLNPYGITAYQGDLYATTGPWFGGAFNTQAVNYRQVGSITFSPTSNYSAGVSYTIDGVAVSKEVERFTFRRLPISGFYHGGWVVRFNDCGFGPEEGTYQTVSLDITDTQTPGTASGQITAVVYEDGYYSCTMTGTYQQFGALFEASTDDCLTGSYVQITDFIPTEISFRAGSVIYGPEGCAIGYSIAAVLVY